MNILRVIYDKNLIGICKFSPEKNLISFEYNPDLIDKNFVLSPLLMPLNNKIYEFDTKTYNPQTFKGLPPMLADSLPDDFGNKMLLEWLLQSKIPQNNLNSIDKLLFVGNRGMGALEYQPHFERKQNDEIINISELLEVANKVYFKRENESAPLDDYHQNLSTLLRIGSSVGGARAKALIAISEKTQEIKAGDVLHKGDFKYYLIKFDGLKNGLEIEPGGYGILEFIYYKMATDAEITMAESKLFNENGRSHFITERFDRKNDKKIHTQTLCAMTGIDFRQPNLIGYEDIFRVLNLLKMDYTEKEQLFRRMVFNVLSFNHDDHTKNFSFLYEDGIWKLAPAYDLIFAFDPQNFWLKQHNISINGKSTEIGKEDLLEVGDKFGIKNSKDIFLNIKEVVSEFRSYAIKYGLNKKKTEKINEVLQKQNVTK